MEVTTDWTIFHPLLFKFGGLLVLFSRPNQPFGEVVVSYEDTLLNSPILAYPFSPFLDVHYLLLDTIPAGPLMRACSWFQ